MSNEIKVDLEGGKEILEAIDRTRIQLESAARQAVINLAAKILFQAKNNCRTLFRTHAEGGSVTGRLMGSLTLATSTGKRAGYQPPRSSRKGSSSPAGFDDTVKVPKTESKNDFKVVVGTNVIYARRVEFGFVGRDSLGRNYNQAGKPYLYPAFFAYENDLTDEIVKELAKREWRSEKRKQAAAESENVPE